MLRIDTRGPPEQRYQILGRIAAGAMGQIYAARVRLSDGRSTEVALKRIKPELQRDRTFREMFYDEVRIASQMQHPNVIRTLELGELDGSIFYAMELVPGLNLADVLARLAAAGERMPLELALGIAVQVLDALEYAHGFTGDDGRPLRLVHRDVSPQNVLLAFDGAVKLLDFGVTKAEGQLHKTQPGMIKGKLAYMAPEQIRGEAVDPRTDLFALGVVLYEAALGVHPFPGRTDPAIITAIMRSDPAAPQELEPRFPRRIGEILLKALEKDPAQRFQSADAMRTAISGFMEVRGWTPSVAGIERLLAALAPERIELLERARRNADDALLVRALEVGASKPAEGLPKLLAPPERPKIPITEEVTVQEIVPPAVRRRTEPDTGEVRPGARLGRYLLVEQLHAGEREIYAAKIDSGPRRFAIKRQSSGKEGWQGFVEELAVAAGLSHPNLIQLIEVVEHHGEPYGVMELVEGTSLARLLERCGSRRVRLSVAVSCRVVADLCRVLHYLHSRSILHRDITPEHVLLTDSGEVKLTHPRSKSPASAYAAPERVTQGLGPETAASDVYSAGVLLSECMAASRVASEIASVMPGLEEVVERAMARAADRRHESARALAADLERQLFLKGEPVTPLEVADWLGTVRPDP